MYTLITGGARAGKTTYAEQLAKRHTGAVTYIATCPRIAGDAELDRRIDRHIAERPAHWTTREEQLDLPGALRGAGDSFVVLDCLTTWLGNARYHGWSEDRILAVSDEARTVALARSVDAVIVTNEVGMGIVPADTDTREYRDLLGTISRQWASTASRALFMAAGRALQLHDPDQID